MHETAVEQSRFLRGLQAVRADDTRETAARAGDDERDLGFERLAELLRDERAELRLGLRTVHDRDELRAPGRLDEPPQELVATVSLVR